MNADEGEGAKEQNSGQCPQCICQKIIQLAESSPCGKLNKFKAKAAEKTCGGTADQSAKRGEHTGDQESKRDEHEDVFKKEGMRSQGGTPCFEQLQADVGPGSGST